MSCGNSNENNSEQVSKKNSIECSELNCNGTYLGPEFINGSDVAHQFSNKMAAKVGDQLKHLFATGNYSMVNFSKIKMTTKGMGTGNVEYHLSIPFKKVTRKEDAYTCFDHCGGWNHTPELDTRILQLNKAVKLGDSLAISPLLKTPEGLQEYWIQWRNRQ